MNFQVYIWTVIPFGLLAIIFYLSTIICMIREKIKKKNAIFSAMAAVFCTFINVIASMNVEIPPPTIYPLDNETNTYAEEIEICIVSDEYNLFETYYSLDGTEPKDGNKYDDVVTIGESTTVSARNKYLWMWSDLARSAYRFEKIGNNGTSNSSYENSDEFEEKNNVSLSESNLISEVEDSKLRPSEETMKESESDTENELSTQESTESPSTASLPSHNQQPSQTQETNQMNIVEGLNILEGANLMTYINQYRVEAGVGTLTWNSDLEQTAQSFVTAYVTGETAMSDGTYWVVGRQCNGAKNAQKAVSDWITGNAYIPSEAEMLLNEDFTEMAGALYYLPDGNEYGYHYFWIVCLR